MRTILAVLFACLVLTVRLEPARADGEPAPAAQPASAPQLAPAAQPASAPQPAPAAQAAPPAPSAQPTPTAPCAVELHAGVSGDDAQAVEEVVCAEVRDRLADRGLVHRIRVAKLGGKVVLTLRELQPSGASTERQLVLSSLDEVPVAAPRLVDALAEPRVVADTVEVTNVVGVEARTPKKKKSEVHALLSMVGVAALGAHPASGAGAEFGIAVGSERWSFAGSLRLVAGSASQVALSGGVRHFFTSSDTAPLLGTGMALESLDIEHNGDGAGLAFYLEAGIDMLRTHQFGGTIALRLDLPAYEVDFSGGYVPVTSGVLSIRF
jgi:hypothetical protein